MLRWDWQYCARPIWCASCSVHGWCCAGDVQQFGFRQIPDDGVYTSGMAQAVDDAVPDQSLDVMAAKADKQEPSAQASYHPR